MEGRAAKGGATTAYLARYQKEEEFRELPVSIVE